MCALISICIVSVSVPPALTVQTLLVNGLPALPEVKDESIVRSSQADSTEGAVNLITGATGEAAVATTRLDGDVKLYALHMESLSVQ